MGTLAHTIKATEDIDIHIQGDKPSLVIKEINSLTHSCMHSFASLAILALSGSAVFMILATGAKLPISFRESCS